MDKRELAKQLDDLAQWETNPFKKRAYSKAGQIISDMGEEAFSSRNDFKDIDGAQVYHHFFYPVRCWFLHTIRTSATKRRRF